MKRFFDFVTLFTSAGTLICCALPALLVAIGAGSVMVSLISSFPQLKWFSVHKVEVFVFAGLVLVAGGILQWRTSKLPCPVDFHKAQACKVGRRLSFYLYLISWGIYLIGGFFAFFAAKLIA